MQSEYTPNDYSGYNINNFRQPSPPPPPLPPLSSFQNISTYTNSLCETCPPPRDPRNCYCDPYSNDPEVICCCCSQQVITSRQQLCSQRPCITGSGNCQCIGEKGSRVSSSLRKMNLFSLKTTPFRAHQELRALLAHLGYKDTQVRDCDINQSKEKLYYLDIVI